MIDSPNDMTKGPKIPNSLYPKVLPQADLNVLAIAHLETITILSNLTSFAKNIFC